MNKKYLIIGMLILTIFLGLGCVDKINKSISNISSNISTNISTNISEEVNKSISNISGKIEQIGKEKIKNVEQKVENSVNASKDNNIDVDNYTENSDSFSNISNSSANATWVIKISGNKDLRFSGVYVDKFGPPIYFNDTVPKEYIVISDSLAIKLQNVKKGENLTIAITKDGQKVTDRSTDEGLSISCNIKCYIY